MKLKFNQKNFLKKIFRDKFFEKIFSTNFCQKIFAWKITKFWECSTIFTKILKKCQNMLKIKWSLMCIIDDIEGIKGLKGIYVNIGGLKWLNGLSD